MKIIKLFFTLTVLVSLISGCSDDHVFDPEDTGTVTGNTNTGSLGDSTPTGKIDSLSFHLLYFPGFAAVIDKDDLSYTQQEVVITAFADDINDLRVDGQTVNFRTEWGTWLDELDSCVLENGQCSVTWRSENPSTTPSDCQVAITAWTIGEESFIDLNGDGFFDAGDPDPAPDDADINAFHDLQEPFLDVNSNGVFDADVYSFGGKPELIDIVDFDGTGTTNGLHDSANGLYDGSRCAADNAGRCSGRTSLIIHQIQTLFIQEPVRDADTKEFINQCE